MVLGFADYPSPIAPGSGRFFGRAATSSDMDLIRAFYADEQGLHPEGPGLFSNT